MRKSSRPKTDFLILLALLSPVLPAFEATAAPVYGTASGCGALFDRLPAETEAGSLVFTESERTIFQKRMQALERVFQDERAMEIATALSQQFKGSTPYLEMAQGRLEDGWSSLGAGPIDVHLSGIKVIYTNRRTGARMVEVPAGGFYCFEFAGSKSKFPCVWYLPQTSGLSRSPQINRLLSTRLAEEFAINNGMVLKIRQRVRRNRDTWTPYSLQEGLDRFAGKIPRIWHQGYKVTYFNDKDGVFVLDDPVGHYFRVYKWVDGKEVPLDWQGQPVVESTSAGEAASHFRYDPEANTRSVNLALLVKRIPMPASVHPPSPPRLREQPELEMVHREAKGPKSPNPPHSPSKPALHLLSQRLTSSKELRWSEFDESQQNAYLELGADTVRSLHQGGRTDPHFLKKLLQLAQESEDSRWYPILDSLSAGHRSFANNSHKAVARELRAGILRSRRPSEQRTAEIRNQLEALAAGDWKDLSAEMEYDLLLEAEDPEWLRVVLAMAELDPKTSGFAASKLQAAMQKHLANLESEFKRDPSGAWLGYSDSLKDEICKMDLAGYRENADILMGWSRVRALLPASQLSSSQRNALLASLQQNEKIYPTPSAAGFAAFDSYMYLARSLKDPQWIKPLQTWLARWKERPSRIKPILDFVLRRKKKSALEPASKEELREFLSRAELVMTELSSLK